MKRLIESLDDPRQVIDPIRKEDFSIRAVVSAIVDAARNTGDEVKREAKDLEAPERSISRGGQSFSESGFNAGMKTDRLKSRIDLSLPIKETRDTEDALMTFPAGKYFNEDVQQRAVDPDINAEQPDFNEIITRSANWTNRIPRDARNHPREGGK